MLTHYLIVASSIAIASLIWWNWLDDHATFHARVRRIPFFGHLLDCSFCLPMWLTFLTVFFFTPLSQPIAQLAPWNGLAGVITRFFLEWFSVAAGMFLIRHSIFMVREIGAVYNHQHRKNHEEDEHKH